MVPKFRCWDERLGLTEVVSIDFFRKKIKINHWEYGDSNFFPLDEVVLMQSTGLKDMNGVDIFEGDIVFDRWANKYTPVFQNGIYMAYNPKNLMQNDPSTQFNIIWKDGCEVIGNIYENPELLEQADEN